MKETGVVLPTALLVFLLSRLGAHHGHLVLSALRYRERVNLFRQLPRHYLQVSYRLRIYGVLLPLLFSALLAHGDVLQSHLVQIHSPVLALYQEQPALFLFVDLVSLNGADRLFYLESARLLTVETANVDHSRLLVDQHCDEGAEGFLSYVLLRGAIVWLAALLVVVRRMLCGWRISRLLRRHVMPQPAQKQQELAAVGELELFDGHNGGISRHYVGLTNLLYDIALLVIPVAVHVHLVTGEAHGLTKARVHK